MATKKTAAKSQPAQVEEPVVEQEVFTAPVVEKKQAKKDTWEFKNRTYYLISNKQPIVMTIPGRHTRKRSLLWFDPERGYQRELRYATNQQSVFVDEQEGPSTLDHIIFRNGTLTVPKEKQNLQKLLSLYHPLNDKLYSEFNAVKNALPLKKLEMHRKVLPC